MSSSDSFLGGMGATFCFLAIFVTLMQLHLQVTIKQTCRKEANLLTPQ